jgi:hypothetical protein
VEGRSSTAPGRAGDRDRGRGSVPARLRAELRGEPVGRCTQRGLNQQAGPVDRAAGLDLARRVLARARVLAERDPPWAAPEA